MLEGRLPFATLSPAHVTLRVEKIAIYSFASPRNPHLKCLAYTLALINLLKFNS